MKPARIVALALMLTAAACSTHRAGGTQVTGVSTTQPAAVSVSVAPMRRISVASSTEFSGTLSAVQSASVGAVVGGRVASVEVRVGDVVRAGQTLVRLDDSQARAQLSQAGAAAGVAGANITVAQAQVVSTQSRLVLAQQTARRMDVLYREGAISAQQHDQSQGDLAAARGASSQSASAVAAAQASAAEARTGVDAAAVPVRQATVVAPFSGLVTQKMVDAGAVVSAGTPLLQLQAIRDLEIDVAVPERDAASINTHTAVSVRVDALGSARIPAWVRAVVPSANASLRSVTLKVALSPRPGLLPGMFARVSIPGTETTHWAVPMQAVVDRAGQTGVFVVAGDTARFRPVTTGATNGRYVAVTGLTGNATRVATSGSEQLSDGSRVEVRP